MKQSRLASLIAVAATLVLVAVALLSDTFLGPWLPAVVGSVVVWVVALGMRRLGSGDTASSTLEESLSSLLEQAPDAVICVNGQSRIVELNRRAQEARSLSDSLERVTVWTRRWTRKLDESRVFVTSECIRSGLNSRSKASESSDASFSGPIFGPSSCAPD